MGTSTKIQTTEKHLVVIDCVVFGFFDSQVKTMLVKGKSGTWSFMSSLVSNDTIEATAQAELCRLPGLFASHLEQLNVYTDFDRYGEQRVMAVAMSATVRFNDLQFPTVPGCHWFAFHELPVLDDHLLSIFLQAKRKLREKAYDFFTMAPLLPPKFTIIQLQRIYESISEMRLDNGNFSKRFLSTNALNRLDEKNIGTSKKGSYYYEFDSKYLLPNDSLQHHK